MGDPNKYLDIAPVFNEGGVPTPPFTGNDEANRLLGRDSNALLIGLVLDQQITMEKAFAGPYELQRRLGHLDVHKIAAMPQEDFLAVMRESPAIHRYPKNMGKRVQDACRVVVEDFGGAAENIWKDQPDAATVMKRIGTVPGIGPAKQKLAMLILGRYYGQDIDGWREAAPVAVPA